MRLSEKVPTVVQAFLDLFGIKNAIFIA